MRADRLLSLMLLLHAKGRMTALELADQLEVSERTIYRDIEALGVAGVPVYTQSGTNGGVFLDEHYRLSLTGLSKTEVQSLFVTSDAGPLATLGLGKTDTLLKLFAALPSIHQYEVERLRQRFYIDPMNWFQLAEMPSVFPALQKAVWEDYQICAVYQRVEGDISERLLDAYALVAKANIWYLVGKKPNGEMRSYRVSRFKAVYLTDTHFERDPDFEVVAYWKNACHIFEKVMQETFPPYPAVVRVHPDAFWYFPSWMNGRYEQLDEPDPEGWIIIRVIFDSIGDARMRVLGLGTHIEVIEPAALHQTVVETAQAIVEFHQRA